MQVSPPAYTLRGSVLDARADALAVPVLPEADGLTVGPGGPELADRLGIDLIDLLERHDATGACGEVIRHVTGDAQTPVVILVGLGSATTDDFRRAGTALGRATKGLGTLATTISAIADDDALRALVVGITLGSYEFHWRSTGAKAKPVANVVLAGGADLEPVLSKAEAVSLASWRARTWCTTPSNLKNPAWLAAEARALFAETGVKVTVWDESELEAQGFGGLIAVGRASATPPRLIRLDYTPAKAIATKGHVVLVGKGITFDTGGLSIKPGDSMVNMKRDMTGGAVVLATVAALAEVGCPIRVTGLIAAAENAIGDNAYRPGDVITHFGGRTTEVTNTDAEGRLVLADALAYAVSEVKPDAIVDVATLTGAMKVALGLRTGGYFANDEALAEALADAATSSGERLWRLPLAAEYEEKLSSKVADADNGAGSPGAITAALFLQHFTGSVPWAHLDIASIGDAVEDYDVYTAGPTGFGARALLHWLESENPLEGIR